MNLAPAALARALLLALLAACGLGRAATTVVDDRGRALSFDHAPRRVVSLSPALTETLCALGACDRLVGTDRHSNWPASVQALPKLGGLDDAPIERIVALQPDLVLAATSTRAVDRLSSLGVRVLAMEPRTLAEVRQVIDRVAQALGTPAAAGQLWQQLEQRLQAAAERVPPAWRGQRVYFEVASVPYAAGEASFIGEVLGRLGLVNVVPRSMGPFPQLSPEFVIRAQPDVVMASAAEAAAMPARPGWGRLQAVQAGHRCGFEPAPYDAMMRAGPRLAEAAEAVAQCLARLGPPRRFETPGASWPAPVSPPAAASR